MECCFYKFDCGYIQDTHFAIYPCKRESYDNLFDVMLSQKAFAEEFMLLDRCLMDLIPSGSTFNEVDNKLVVDEKR